MLSLVAGLGLVVVTLLALHMASQIAGPVVSPLLLRACVDEAQGGLLELATQLEDHHRARTIRRAVFVSLAATHAQIESIDSNRLALLLADPCNASSHEIDTLTMQVWDHLPQVARTTTK